MSKFSEGTRVVVIEDNEVKRGTIKSTYSALEIAVIEFDDGEVEKVGFDQLGIEPETKVQKNREVKTESQEGAKVITEDQFIEAVNYVTSPKGMLGDKVDEVDPSSVMIKGVVIKIIGMRIGKKLFQDKEEIEITKDQLEEVIKENTDPNELSKMIDNKMSMVRLLPISLLSALVLPELVHILFDDSEK